MVYWSQLRQIIIMSKQDSAQVKTIPPLIPAIFILIAWTLDKYIYDLPIPLAVQVQIILAYIIMPIALVLFAFSLYFFITYKQNPDPHTPTKSLYTGGIFKITRNPIYLGFLFAQSVVAIKLNNFYIILSLPFTIILLNKWIVEPEESYLEKLFGEEYLDYKKKVRRWL
jgi:protein-S-isoprenylcysteine O-methyltransferase Ste14